MNIKDSVVWITGASSGIGEALTYEVNRRGAKVIISSRRAEVLNEVKSKCAFPANVHVLTIDLEQINSLEEKAKNALKIFGKISSSVQIDSSIQLEISRETIDFIVLHTSIRSSV